MSVSKRARFEVFKRDGFTCQYCGQQPPSVILEVDHIDPRAAGGSDDDINLITSCFDCNRGKSDRKLGDIHPRPDADLKYLKAQQEIAEAKRYLKTAKLREKAFRKISGELLQIWLISISDEYTPTDSQWQRWLSTFSADEIEYAIRTTGPKFSSGRFGSPRGNYAVGRAISYISGVMYKVRKDAATEGGTVQ